MQRLYLLLEANLVNIFLHCFEFWFMQTNTWTNSINTYHIAGGSGFCDTWFLDLTENTWTKGPDMSTCRFKHTCSLLKDTNEIVIVGGSAKPTDSSCTRKDRVRLSSVEILDLKTNKFRDGKFKSQDIVIWIKCNIIYRDLGTPFPMASQAHAVLPYEDSFLIMGGGRCPPSECDACGCKKCSQSSAINKSVLL